MNPYVELKITISNGVGDEIEVTSFESVHLDTLEAVDQAIVKAKAQAYGAVKAERERVREST